jgi:hypothetical protein
MKANFLKIEKPCEEKWENMTPNDKGNFCDLCSKNVIDFTQLSQIEISKILSKSKGKICARVTSDQLKMPLIDTKPTHEFNFPFKNVAAGIMIASTLIGCQNTTKGKVSVETEQIASTNSLNQLENKKTKTKPEQPTAPNVTTFKGKVTSEKTGKPIENAEIIFAHAQKQFRKYTAFDGTFSMEIPNELIDDDNVVRVLYWNAKKTEEKESQFGYQGADYILTKSELKSDFNIKATKLEIYLGGIIGYPADYSPIVLVNGKETSYKEFQKAQEGKKSTCDINNKDFLFFESKEAIAIYGQRAKDGLYIITDKK